MTRPNPNNSISAHAVPSRRLFLSQAAGLAAGGTALALATVTPKPAAAALPADDSLLLKLEEQIFDQYEGATQYDDEIMRASEIWTEEMRRFPAGMTPKERGAAVMGLPACIEHNRVCKLQEPYVIKMDALIQRMFAIPALTADGRRAKATVLLGCILSDDWRRTDKETEYPELMARTSCLSLSAANRAKCCAVSLHNRS